MTRDEIEEELLAWMQETPWRRDEARFERLALALFRFQFEACPPYTRFCRSLDRAPENVNHSDGIPAVPTGAFKEFDLCCFDPASTVKCFRTSGTATERRGQLRLDTLRLYETSLLANLRTTFLADLCDRRPTMRILAPSAEEAPDSSLSHMFASLLAAEGDGRSGFDLVDGRLDVDSLRGAVARSQRDGTPLVLAGTSFAFVHLLDAIVDDEPSAWKLAAGSRLMETGGFKGRSREVSRDVLRDQLAARFGLPSGHVINQYGMTELGSQFYDSTLIDPSGPRRKLIPPWTRVRIVDPESGNDVDGGEVGLIVVHDLANTGSIAAIQTADLGRMIRDTDGDPCGFDVLGRSEGAEARGCSIATDAMLEASQREAER